MAKRKSQDELATSIKVLKTYKMYIGGSFPRTESGRFYSPVVNNQSLGNLCLASRKDVRNAVVAARAAQSSWANRSAYNRGQIVYRIAEMLDDRREQFHSELIRQGHTSQKSKQEVQRSIDCLIAYAGWCDKYQQIFSCVNPVASGHFNFSSLEPMGVVFVIANETAPLLGLISMVIPVIVGGNTCVVLAAENKPLSAITLAEVLNSSDVPGGVINILTGKLNELANPIARHMDINAVAFDRDDENNCRQMQKLSADNLKRFAVSDANWLTSELADPFLIERFCELKTTWHPVERIGPTGSGY